MRKRIILAGITILLVSIIFLVGCGADEPEINKENSAIVQLTDLEHITYIPIQNQNLAKLMADVDGWIKVHPEREVISVQVINATKYAAGYAGYTLPSGAMIVHVAK